MSYVEGSAVNHMQMGVDKDFVTTKDETWTCQNAQRAVGDEQDATARVRSDKRRRVVRRLGCRTLGRLGQGKVAISKYRSRLGKSSAHV